VRGLSGEITVNGKRKFDSAMTLVILDDQQVAERVDFWCAQFWGNEERGTAEEVKTVRAKTGFPTFAAFSTGRFFCAAAQAAEGIHLAGIVRTPTHCVRMASDGFGRIIMCSPKMAMSGGSICQQCVSAKVLWAKLPRTAAR